MCTTKRLQLRDWLKLKIDSGRVPGLKWLDREKQIFRVPWKHASRANWKEETDASLFRDWAEYTGKYRRGVDQPEPKRWKTNFRCALNALPDIVELTEKSCTIAQDPQRVFQMKKREEKTIKKRKGAAVDNADHYVSSCYLLQSIEFPSADQEVPTEQTIIKDVDEMYQDWEQGFYYLDVSPLYPKSPERTIGTEDDPFRSLQSISVDEMSLSSLSDI